VGNTNRHKRSFAAVSFTNVSGSRHSSIISSHCRIWANTLLFLAWSQSGEDSKRIAAAIALRWARRSSLALTERLAISAAFSRVKGGALMRERCIDSLILSTVGFLGCNPGFAYAIGLGLGGLILLISAYRNQFVASGLKIKR